MEKVLLSKGVPRGPPPLNPLHTPWNGHPTGGALLKPHLGRPPAVTRMLKVKLRMYLMQLLKFKGTKVGTLNSGGEGFQT